MTCSSVDRHEIATSRDSPTCALKAHLELLAHFRHLTEVGSALAGMCRGKAPHDLHVNWRIWLSEQARPLTEALRLPSIKTTNEPSRLRLHGKQNTCWTSSSGHQKMPLMPACKGHHRSKPAAPERHHGSLFRIMTQTVVSLRRHEQMQQSISQKLLITITSCPPSCSARLTEASV